MSKINKEKQAAVPQKLLHELFEYNELTGGWKWVKKPSNRANVKAGQVAGCLDKKSGYIRIQINGYNYYAHRLAWTYIYGDYPSGEQPFIDHINGKKDDNRITNLKCSSGHENMRNQKMTSRNTSSVTGVQRKGLHNRSKKNPKINYYWVAYWYDENGKSRAKCFNIEELSEEGAKRAAIEHRVEQLRKLKVNFGIVYSERHGLCSNL